MPRLAQAVDLSKPLNLYSNAMGHPLQIEIETTVFAPLDDLIRVLPHLHVGMKNGRTPKEPTYRWREQVFSQILHQ